jgi:hypothetical protein
VPFRVSSLVLTGLQLLLLLPCLMPHRRPFPWTAATPWLALSWRMC